MKNIIDRIPRSAVLVVIAGALIIAPTLVLANQGGNDKHDDNKPAVTTVAKISPAQVTIGNNGNVTVKGAVVTGVNGSTITATTVWGSDTLTWTINTGSSTQFLFKGGKSAVLGTVVVGDNVNFNGALSGNGLVVAATTVRDNSKEQVVAPDKHTFEGKLNSAVGTTSLPTSFNLTVGNNTVTVNVPVNTPVLNKVWASVNLGSFVAGDTVRVYGSAEASTSNVIDAVVVRDATR